MSGQKRVEQEGATHEGGAKQNKSLLQTVLIRNATKRNLNSLPSVNNLSMGNFELPPLSGPMPPLKRSVRYLTPEGIVETMEDAKYSDLLGTF